MDDHEASKLFPRLGWTELSELADDIATNGLQHPIVVWEGAILDGRNRLAACKLANVDPRFEILPVCASPTAYVISANLKRRHLNTIQRGSIAVRAVAMFKEEAAARQRAAGARGKEGGRGHKKNPQARGRPKGSDEGKATRQAAKAVGVGHGTVETLARIQREAPDVFEAAERGEIPTVADAQRQVECATQAQQNEVDTSPAQFARRLRRLAQECRTVARLGTEVEQTIAGVSLTEVDARRARQDIAAAHDVLRRVAQALGA